METKKLYLFCLYSLNTLILILMQFALKVFIHEMIKLKNEMEQLKNQNQVTKVVQDLETPVFVKMNDDKPIYKNKKA